MSTELTEPQKGNRPGLETYVDGLTAIALANGNARKASRELKKIGVKISPATLYKWKREHSEEYDRIRSEQLHRIGGKLAEQHLDLAAQQMEHASVLEAELFAERKTMEPRDKVNLLGKQDIGSGIHSQRARELQGDLGTPPEATRTATEVLRKLAARGMVIEGDAEDITDAVPVE